MASIVSHVCVHRSKNIVIRSVYHNSKSFEVTVGMHQGELSPLFCDWLFFLCYNRHHMATLQPCALISDVLHLYICHYFVFINDHSHFSFLFLELSFHSLSL